MKQELIKNLNPVIEKFADDVLKSFGDIEKIRSDIIQREALLTELITVKEKELSDIRISKATTQVEIDKKITDMELSKNKHTQKAKSYQELIDEIDRKRIEIDGDLDKARIELVRAKDIRLQAEKQKDDSNKLKNDYELKLESLNHDTKKIKNDNEDINSSKVKNTAREQEIFKTESRQELLAKDLSERELKIKSERKEIDRLIKLYKLKV